ncbi:MAG: hypothetical protein O2925_02780 [Actinomycetota bacterium]|nr:hypothetical protein [Actinomycetota bacterium]MDA3027698.1 hypothetical protein [Actinomycetota bacterium]
MTSESQDHQGTTERSTSGTVRRRRTVRRGPAIGGDDPGDEFVKVRSVAEEPGGRVIVDDGDAVPVTDTITPDEVTSTPPVEATPASMPVSDSATLALVLDAVRSFLEGHDGLGGDHPVTQDRLERLRRVAVLVERD